MRDEYDEFNEKMHLKKQKNFSSNIDTGSIRQFLSNENNNVFENGFQSKYDSKRSSQGYETKVKMIIP